MPSFKTLWENFPYGDDITKKCFNKQSNEKGGDRPFKDYCAIRMSECFIQCGVSLNKCPGVKCWSHAGAKHILRAEQLANWLASSPPDGFGAKEGVTPSNFQSLLSGRTGIVFFKDYWRRGEETKESFVNRSGDHIDLWNHNRITGSSMWFRAIMEFFNLLSDLNKSKEVWFWEVK